LESERKLFDLIDPTNHLNIPDQNSLNSPFSSPFTSSDNSSDNDAAAGKWMTVEKLSPSPSSPTLEPHTLTFHSPIYSRPTNPDDNVLERPLLIIIRYFYNLL